MAPPNSSAIPPSTDLEENKRAQARNSQDASSDQALIEKLKAEVEALKGREKEVKEREKKAEEREKEAKENEKKAEEREKEAKENEKKAEEREKEAKEREKKAEEALNASMARATLPERDPSLWRSVNATGALACTCVYAFCDKRIALQKATGLVFSGRAGAQIGMNFFSIGLALPAPFRTVPASRKNED
eukprot:tig00021435_g21413.t3